MNLTEMFGVFEIKGVLIYYQEISTGLVKTTQQNEKTILCHDVEAGHCLIPGLKAFTLYKLRARWSNEKGLGPFSDVIEAGSSG